MSEYFRFMQDDDLHWYKVPYNLTSRFLETLLELDDNYETFINEFGFMACSDPSNYIVEIVNES